MNSRIINNEQEEAQHASSINENDILGSVKGSAKRPGLHGVVKELDETELIRACSISIEQDDHLSQYCIGDDGLYYFDDSGPVFYFDNVGLPLLETDASGEPELIRACSISIEQNTPKQPWLERNSYHGGDGMSYQSSASSDGLEVLIRAKDISIENGWTVIRGNAPSNVEMSATSSEISEKLMRAGDVSIEPMAAHVDGEILKALMVPASQLERNSSGEGNAEQIENYFAAAGIKAVSRAKIKKLQLGLCWSALRFPTLASNIKPSVAHLRRAAEYFPTLRWHLASLLATFLYLFRHCAYREITHIDVYYNLGLNAMKEEQNMDCRKETWDTSNSYQTGFACLISGAVISMSPEGSLDCTSQNASSLAIGTESSLADELIRVSKDNDTGHWKAGLLQVNDWKEALGMHNSSRQGSKDFSLYQASRIACLISDEVNIMRPEGSLRPSICTDALTSTSHVSSATQDRKPDCPLLEGNHANYPPNILESHFYPESAEVGSLPSFAFKRMTLGNLIKAMITAAQISSMWVNFSLTRQNVEQNDRESSRRPPTLALNMKPRPQQTMPTPRIPTGAVGTASAVFSISSPTTGEAAPTVRLFPPHPGEC